MDKFEKEIHSITKKVNDVYGSIFKHFENQIAQLQNEIESLLQDVDEKVKEVELKFKYATNVLSPLSD